LDQQSLSARPESLDAALTSLRLSPFPALVVGVEGATEYLLVPRVMDLLGIQWDTNRIRIVDFGGTVKTWRYLLGMQSSRSWAVTLPAALRWIGR
jgi:hypothetical protein